MASICFASPPLPLSQRFQQPTRLPSLCAHRLTPKLAPGSSNSGKTIRLSARQRRLFYVFASNSTISSEEDSVEQKSESNDAQGPPLLTILAGFVTLFLVTWIVGSSVMWVFGLVFKLLATK